MSDLSEMSDLWYLRKPRLKEEEMSESECGKKYYGQLKSCPKNHDTIVYCQELHLESRVYIMHIYSYKINETLVLTKWY